jgi:glycerol uptake facilitator-like aquaporin
MTKKAEIDGKPPPFFGIAIGFVIIAGGYGGGTVSGGCFNPAVALGVNFMSPSVKSLYLPIYMAAEMAGAFIAVTVFHLVRKECKIEAFEHYGKLQQICNKIEEKFDPEDTCELIGTFLLTLTWALNTLAAESELPSAAAGVWSIAACLMSLIYATGDISGGLFNPALTLAALGRFYGTNEGIGEKNAQGNYDRLCDPKMSSKEGPKYLIAQGIGGAAGAACSFFVTFHWPPAANVGPEKKPNGDHYGIGQAFFAEFFGTFLLAFVVLSVALVKKPKAPEYNAFAIGGCIVAAGYGFAPLSGGVLNPAIALANGVLRGVIFTTAAPALYILAEALGGVAAAAVFKFLTHTSEYEDVPSRGQKLP